MQTSVLIRFRLRMSPLNPFDPEPVTAPETESQTLRALLKMRALLIAGEYKPGERIREVSLAARLGVSRTPLRLVLERLEHEGLLQARERRLLRPPVQPAGYL